MAVPCEPHGAIVALAARSPSHALSRHHFPSPLSSNVNRAINPSPSLGNIPTHLFPITQPLSAVINSHQCPSAPSIPPHHSASLPTHFPAITQPLSAVINSHQLPLRAINPSPSLGSIPTHFPPITQPLSVVINSHQCPSAPSIPPHHSASLPTSFPAITRPLSTANSCPSAPSIPSHHSAIFPHGFPPSLGPSPLPHCNQSSHHSGGIDQPNLHQPPIPSFASHTARNPLQPIIPPNQRSAQPVDKLSRHTAQIIRQQRQAEFLQDLAEFQTIQQKTIADLSAKYHRKPGYMKKVLTGHTHYKTKRATNLHNAKIAYKRPGDPSYTKRQAVRDDATLQNLSKERSDELIRLLEAERSVKKTGARVSNRAAAHDYRVTIGRIGEELANLESRTGATGFAFFSRTHINDSMQPEWVSASDALEFLPESMQTSAGEMGRKLELWACNKDNSEFRFVRQ
ncbi:hypothetical protein Agabi119p4_1194 [Agaricus bisporus var. burnettii]|uniref:Uncharacterized protein n=1 Tax=Agaricus bisporus var. burnettii TaxID=192524 RepID=A0A8H7FC55_AGABI|nr:hypothetical protein Agabi119p4_1194 [Agaricus bisporus var. burnettii]